MMAKTGFWSTASMVGFGFLLAACSSGSAAPPPVGAATASVLPSASSRPTTASTSLASPTSGSPVKSDPVEAAFKSKVDALCLSWLADGNKHPAPSFYVGNPLAIDAARLPQVASWLDSLAVSHDLVQSMEKLGTPAEGAQSWSALSKHFAVFHSDQTAAIAAAKASDLNGWTTNAVAADKERDEILSGLITSGFPFSDSCQIVFARGAYHGE